MPRWCWKGKRHEEPAENHRNRIVLVLEFTDSIAIARTKKNPWNRTPMNNPAIHAASYLGLVRLRHAITGDVKVGDVAPTVLRGRQQPQEREMVNIANSTPDRRGAIHQSVLGRRAWDAELEGELAPREGSDQFVHGVLAEHRLGGWEIELGQAEVGAPHVQAHKEVVAAEAHLVARFGYEVSVSCGSAPCSALCRGQCAPAAGDSADVVAVALLLVGLRIAGAHELARDVAVTAFEIDDRALPARLGNGADFHVVSGIRLLRRWFPRPQSGGCCSHVQT
jgi:hypothetical protein